MFFKKISLLFICLSLGSLCAEEKFSFFVLKSLPASEQAMEIISENNDEYTLEVNRHGDYVFIPKEIKNETGFIFYPGGRVKCEAYLPLVKELAKKGYLSVLVRMPRELAIYDMDAASSYVKAFPQIKHWFLGGHSLGGSLAAAFIAKKSNIYDGLVLCASFSTKKIDESIKVLSLYGSCDGILNMESYEKYKKNLPADFVEVIIGGGCHSYFGDYGMQSGDGTPFISRNLQINFTVDAIDDFMSNSF